MIEVYAFYAVFFLQLLLMSILQPWRVAQRVRQGMARYPAQDYPQLYPDGEETTVREQTRYLRGYLLLNSLIATVGLVLLAWLFTRMQRMQQGQYDVAVTIVIVLYYMLQLVPILLFQVVVAWKNSYLRKVMQSEKRTAVLQPRRLFDFVSPVIVLLTLLCYPAFVALVFYTRHVFPHRAASDEVLIAGISLYYAMCGLGIYRTLYGRKSNPLQSNQDRIHEISVGVKTCVYGALAVVLYFMVNQVVVVLDRQGMELLALSCHFVIVGLLVHLAVLSQHRGTTAIGSDQNGTRTETVD